MENNKPDYINLKIDFAGIGFPKCGTTFLSEALRKHPEINISSHKETNFFMDKGSMLSSYIGPETWDEYVKEYDLSVDKVRGEYSVYYIFNKKSLQNIKNNYPDIKIILALRNPVDFLYSTYWYVKNSNARFNMPKTFEEAVFTKETKYPCNITYGYFSKYIKDCYDVFDKKNVIVILVDDIKNNPKETIRKLYSHVGVSHDFNPDMEDKKVNAGKSVRVPILLPLIRIFIKLFRVLGLRSFLHDFINGKSRVRLAYQKIMFTNKKYPPMDMEIREKILEELSSDIDRTASLINRDLSFWKN